MSNKYIIFFTIESAEENILSEDDYLPKVDEDSDMIKSGETVTSDSDADNTSKTQQQNSIQTWINDSHQDEGQKETSQGHVEKADS